MKKTISLITFIFFLTSCNRLTEKHFKTSDLTTGGFTDIRLDLNADNTLRLIKIDQKVIDQNDSGTVYHPDTLLISGTWTIHKENFHCEIKESEEFIGDAFFKSPFKTKGSIQNYNVVVFPVTTDTIFIFGQPCVKTKTTTR